MLEGCMNEMNVLMDIEFLRLFELPNVHYFFPYAQT